MNNKLNYCLEGRGKECKITKVSDDLLTILNKGYLNLEKQRISSYTVIDETNKEQYSFWKGALGVALLGGIGAVAGIAGKKKKEYLIAVEWKDGERSLICLDNEYYKVFVKSMW